MSSSAPVKVTLFRDRDAPASYTWSAFVTKLETRLRFSQVSYTAKPGSLSQSPKGKLPYVTIVDSKTGESTTVSDTSLITQALINDGHMNDLNAHLSPSQKAIDLSIRALLEDKLYFILAKERWIDNFYTMRDVGPLAVIPYPIRLLVGHLAHGKITRTLFGQGTGRYSEEELDAMRREIWGSLDGLIAESQSRVHGRHWVLGGENPTESDACLHGFLASALTSSANPGTKALLRENYPHLLAYASSIHDEYFPDYQKWDQA